MERIADLLLDLENKYTNSVPLVQILENKYSFRINGGEKEKNQEKIPLKEPDKSHFVLSNDAEENGQFINRLIAGADGLAERLNIPEEDALSVKIIEDYKKQLGKIADKKLESGEKLAGSVCKCIKKTIMKLLDMKDYGKEIMKYLRANGFKLDSFERGHKLSDDDLCFLDEYLLQAYKVRTDNPDDNYRVIDMIQPIIRIFYMDEDDEETYSHFLPGICRYFVRR